MGYTIAALTDLPSAMPDEIFKRDISVYAIYLLFPDIFLPLTVTHSKKFLYSFGL
jgi:hypothetical protein